MPVGVSLLLFLVATLASFSRLLVTWYWHKEALCDGSYNNLKSKISGGVPP